MPTYQTIYSEIATLVVGKYPQEVSEFKGLYLRKEKKKYEKNMVREMLNNAFPSHCLLYEEDGRPYLEGSLVEISISHSYPYAVLAWSSTKKIGVDIELCSDRLAYISPKFLSEKETKWVDKTDQFLLGAIWTIKESLYKIHPTKYWSFREHYQVEPFAISDNTIISCAVIGSEGDRFLYQAIVYQIDNYILALVSTV